jgi:hypothetical protein
MTIPNTALQVSGERFAVLYQFTGDEATARAKAEAICIEQTIEFPADLVPQDSYIRREIFGRVESLDPAPSGDGYIARISFDESVAGGELTQFINVIFGNISIKPGIRLVGLSLTEGMLKRFRGPRFGRDGLRRILGAHGRPILCTALRPMGLSADELADLAYRFALGGIDIIKDDHGLANQECLGWILNVVEKFGGVPSKEDLEKYAWDTLNSGKVIPGYGHAVLRVVDPRYEQFLKWGKEHIKGDPVFDTVALVFDVVPGVLRQIKKISDPWPNVDAGSGALLYHFGLREFPYYTVLFGVSRAMGVIAQAIEARAKGYPIIRPKSIPTSKLKEIIGVN